MVSAHARAHIPTPQRAVSLVVSLGESRVACQASRGLCQACTLLSTNECILCDHWVAYLGAADNVLGPLASRLSSVN
jgi:hypothetical protein